MGPLTIHEMVLHLQARGWRAGDDPRRVHENLRSALRYRNAGFVRDSKRRWMLADNR
jgi:hypothetical protein